MIFEGTVSDLLANGLAVRFRARGHSMHPTIRCGETMHVEPVALCELAPGDVVLARQPRGLTAHRIVRIEGDRIITRGDNCSDDDPDVAGGDVLGRVRLVGGRRWVRRALTNFSRRGRRLYATARVLWQMVF